MKRFALGFALLAVLCTGVQAQVDQKKKDLEQYRNRIRDQKERLKGVVSKEGSLLREMQRMSAKIDRLRTEVATLERDRSGLEEEIRKTGRETERIGEEIRSNETFVAARFRALYKWGEPGDLRLLLSSDSPDDFRRRRVLLHRWVDLDQRVIEGHRERVGSLTRTRQTLTRQQAEKEKLAVALTGKLDEMAAEKSDRQTLLAMVRDEKVYYERNVRELEQAARELQRLVETLRRGKRGEESPFARMKGKLDLPVPGTLERPFGPYVDPKYRTKLYHKGIDLRAGEGTPVRAVFGGKVAYAGWFVGYGKILIVDHGSGYFTLYAHAKDLLKKEEDRVSAGEPIARVGDTDSLKGAYLYFELRDKGISQDPWPWFAGGK